MRQRMTSYAIEGAVIDASKIAHNVKNVRGQGANSSARIELTTVDTRLIRTCHMAQHGTRNSTILRSKISSVHRLPPVTGAEADCRHYISTLLVCFFGPQATMYHEANTDLQLIPPTLLYLIGVQIDKVPAAAARTRRRPSFGDTL